ncbi:MAG TPA: hypothetical protein QGF95_07720 [Candidatus Latescibacteria bacterium]|jgi:hypothetical protein|nr:hypothetical protein [Gemmatimonadaceae bacterium]MDP6016514.1 hypothetical protein [Candidatus Latescibacterota bacterium]HJP30426.1 hypothetical protein [Candidatus Latescibacterota bacterium]
MTAANTIAAVLLSACLTLQAADASCGTASCPLDLNSLAQDFGETPGGLRLQLSYEAIDQDQPRQGSRDVAFQQIRRPDHDEIETVNRNWSLRATWSAGRRWDLGVTLPFVHRRHSHVAVAGHAHDEEEESPPTHVGINRWDFTQLADIVIRADFRPLDGSELRLGVGLRLPNGATDIRSAEGVLAEPALQPGTGAPGVVIDAGYGGSATGARREVRWFASSSCRWNAAGKGDYRIGAQWLTHAGLHVPLHARVEWLTQIVGRWRGGDEAGRTTELVDATGGSALFLSPGVRVKLTDGIWLSGYWQVPVYEDVNRVQLTADQNLLLVVAWELRLGS